MTLELTHDDLDRLIRAATRWQRRATGGPRIREIGSLALLAAEIGAIVARLTRCADNARLVWEGRHLHALLSHAMYFGARPGLS